MERGEELMQQCREAFDRNTVAYEENHLFMRDMNRRSEKVVQDLLRSHERFQRELSAEMRSKTDAILSD
jgi:hypothetical protein